MRETCVSGAAVSILALSAAAAHAAGLEIRHEPLTCVAVDHFTRVVATATLPAAVASAELQFRLGPESDWYGIRMKDAGGEWSALLPRPRAGLQRFEYRVVMTSSAAEVVATAPAGVSVTPPAGCPAADSRSASSERIVVSVPAGAPAVPPVPAGFSPTGVAPAQEVRASKGSPAKWLLLGGALVGGGVGAALAFGGGDSATPAPDIPGFAFDGTFPLPGSTISLTRTQLQILVRMSREPERPLTFDWRVGLFNAGGAPCVGMSGTFSGAQRPPGLVLSAPLLPTGSCGAAFAVTTTRIVITIRDETVLDTSVELPFRFEP